MLGLKSADGMRSIDENIEELEPVSGLTRHLFVCLLKIQVLNEDESRFLEYTPSRGVDELGLQTDHLDGQSGNGRAFLPQLERCSSEGEEDVQVQVVG